VREQRNGLRVALKLGKILFSEVSSHDIKKERTLITKIRNIIVEARPDVLSAAIEDIAKPANGWYLSLVQEILDGKHGLQ